MHTKFERLLSKSLTTLEVVTYYLVVHNGKGWPSGKGDRLEIGRPGFDSRFLPEGLFPGGIMAVTVRLALQWLPCQALGAIRSTLGRVGLVSVFCDWVR